MLDLKGIPRKQHTMHNYFDEVVIFLYPGNGIQKQTT